MSKIAKAYEALKGDLGNCRSPQVSDKFLYFDKEDGIYVCLSFRSFSSYLKYICKVEEFNNYKPQKTVVDAVKELKADLGNSYGYNREEDSIICFDKYEGDIICDEARYKSNYKENYICNISEFNTEVESMSNDAGTGKFLSYQKATKTPLTKEAKVDYKSEEFWKDAPKGVKNYATMEPWGEEHIYWLDDDGYWFEEKYYKFGVFTESTANFVKDEFTIVATRPKPSPVFTKAMSDAGEQIKQGMLFQCKSGEVAELLLPIDESGMGVAMFDGEYCIMCQSGILPIDTSTDKEKAIDDIYNNTLYDNINEALSNAYDKWVK